MSLVQPDVVAAHIGLRHRTLVDLIAPECEYWNTVPETTVHIHLIIHQNSSPLSFFFVVQGNHSLIRSVVPGGGPWGIEGCCSNQDDRGCWRATSSQQELPHEPLPHCCFPLHCMELEKSLQKRCHHQGQPQVGLGSLIGVSNSMSSISHKGCSFFGAPGAFGALFSFFSFSPCWPTLAEGFETGIGGSCPAAPCPVSAAFGGGLPAWQGLLLLILRILKGGDCILG